MTPGSLCRAVQVWLAVFLCPLDILWRPSRVFLLRILRHLALAPLYRVMLADFFVGDQLTSQVAAPPSSFPPAFNVALSAAWHRKTFLLLALSG